MNIGGAVYSRFRMEDVYYSLIYIFGVIVDMLVFNKSGYLTTLYLLAVGALNLILMMHRL